MGGDETKKRLLAGGSAVAHAQTVERYTGNLANEKMSGYLIIQGTITNEEKWTQYRRAVVPLIQKFGGRHLTGGGSPILLEGQHESWRIAMFEFPSMDAIDQFWNSADYQPLKELRRDAATLDIWAVPGK